MSLIPSPPEPYWGLIPPPWLGAVTKPWWQWGHNPPGPTVFAVDMRPAQLQPPDQRGSGSRIRPLCLARGQGAGGAGVPQAFGAQDALGSSFRYTGPRLPSPGEGPAGWTSAGCVVEHGWVVGALSWPTKGLWWWGASLRAVRTWAECAGGGPVVLLSRSPASPCARWEGLGLIGGSAKPGLGHGQGKKP